jgi:hypothetical protein
VAGSTGGNERSRCWRTWGCVVTRNKYFEYARECVRQAGKADCAERHDKLMDSARVWTEAALVEEARQRGLTRSDVKGTGRYR